MPHLTLSEPPLTTPLFRDLSVREWLRLDRPFRFLISEVWSSWFSEVATKARPLIVKATLNFPDTAAQTSSDLTVTVAGAATDHPVEVAPPPASVLANSSYYAWVSAVNVVTVRFCNFSTGALNPDSGTFTVIVR